MVSGYKWLQILDFEIVDSSDRLIKISYLRMLMLLHNAFVVSENMHRRKACICLDYSNATGNLQPMGRDDVPW